MVETMGYTVTLKPINWKLTVAKLCVAPVFFILFE